VVSSLERKVCFLLSSPPSKIVISSLLHEELRTDKPLGFETILSAQAEIVFKIYVGDKVFLV
jgi:hypothetical protein